MARPRSKCAQMARLRVSVIHHEAELLRLTRFAIRGKGGVTPDTVRDWKQKVASMKSTTELHATACEACRVVEA